MLYVSPLTKWIELISLLIYTHCLISPAGMDYEAVTTNLTFNNSTSAQVVTIPIVDDLVVENYLESFRVTLATFDTAVTLRSQTTSLTIRDNDSKLHCTSNHNYIMLFESSYLF